MKSPELQVNILYGYDEINPTYDIVYKTDENGQRWWGYRCQVKRYRPPPGGTLQDVILQETEIHEPVIWMTVL